MKINDQVSFQRTKYTFFKRRQLGTILSFHTINNETFATVIFIENNIKLAKILRLKDIQPAIIKNSNWWTIFFVLVTFSIITLLLFLLWEEIVAEFKYRVQVKNY